MIVCRDSQRQDKNSSTGCEKRKTSMFSRALVKSAFAICGERVVLSAPRFEICHELYRENSF